MRTGSRPATDEPRVMSNNGEPSGKSRAADGPIDQLPREVSASHSSRVEPPVRHKFSLAGGAPNESHPRTSPLETSHPASAAFDSSDPPDESRAKSQGATSNLSRGSPR